jgi:transcriptional regulator with XRE-family HTH domain
METQYRSRRLRAAQGLPPIPRRTLKPTPIEEQTPPAGQPFQPWTLTIALDAHDLYDPELSNTLGVPMGEVDRWEEGISEPTLEQARALCKLMGYQLNWFYRSKPPPEMTHVFLCPGGATDPDPIVSLGRGRWKVERERPDAYQT